MGQVFYPISADQVERTVEAVADVAAKLTQVLIKMREAGMEEAMFPWTQRQWVAQDVLATLAEECAAKIQPQVNAFKQGRPSNLEMQKERSKRDMAKKAERANAAEKPEKKPRKRASKKSGG